jgi:hypothetical protein
MTRRDLNAVGGQIYFYDITQDVGHVRKPNEYFPFKISEINRRLGCQRAITQQNHDQRFVGDHLIADFGLGLDAQETEIDLATLERLGDIERVKAR